MNATVPVGEFPVTIAVRVTAEPKGAGLAEDWSAVVVGCASGTKCAVTLLGAVIESDCGLVLLARSPEK